MDHPGLMQSVSHLLGEMGVNIESVGLLAAAGAVHQRAAVRDGTRRLGAGGHPVAALREALGELCDEMNIDWQLTAL